MIRMWEMKEWSIDQCVRKRGRTNWGEVMINLNCVHKIQEKDQVKVIYGVSCHVQIMNRGKKWNRETNKLKKTKLRKHFWK